MTPVRAAARVAAALCVAAAALLLPAPPVGAGERCVGVVVDARLLGGDVRTGCAKGDPGSGLEALADAGFRYAFAPRQPGLVCQIDGAPQCADTSTTTYWSYWYRAKGSRSWVYASEGSGSHDPAPGSTEAWVWQDGGRRTPPDVAQRTICPVATTSPGARSSPEPGTAKTSTPRMSTPKASTPTSSSAATGSSPRKTKAARSETPSVTTAPPSSPAAATPPPATASPATTPAATPAAASSPVDDGGTPWTGVAVGAVLVAALAAAAVARSRRGGP